jgi:hypothetical protein
MKRFIFFLGTLFTFSCLAQAQTTAPLSPAQRPTTIVAPVAVATSSTSPAAPTLRPGQTLFVPNSTNAAGSANDVNNLPNGEGFTNNSSAMTNVSSGYSQKGFTSPTERSPQPAQQRILLPNR